jgi:hypothetical protein
MINYENYIKDTIYINKMDSKDTKVNTKTTKTTKTKSKCQSKIYFFISNEYDVNINDFEDYLNDFFKEKVKVYITDDKNSETNLIYNIYIKENLVDEKHFNIVVDNIHQFVGTKFNIFYKKLSSSNTYDYKHIVSLNKPLNEKLKFIEDDSDEE